MSASAPCRARHICALLVASAALIAVTCGARAPAAEPAAADPHAEGKTVYGKWCAACHDPGVIHPGTHALEAKYQGKRPAVILEWTDLTADYVRYIVRHGMSVMPQFRKTEITDQELDALAAYLSRNTPRP
jgi:mono/diheme cytochrome c family protein